MSSQYVLFTEFSLTCPYVKACCKDESSHGRPEKFFQEGKRGGVAYPFQTAGVAMQMDVLKTLYALAHKCRCFLNWSINVFAIVNTTQPRLKWT